MGSRKVMCACVNISVVLATMNKYHLFLKQRERFPSKPYLDHHDHLYRFRSLNRLSVTALHRLYASFNSSYCVVLVSRRLLLRNIVAYFRR